MPPILSPPLIFLCFPRGPHVALKDVVVQPGDPSFDIAAGQFTVGKPKGSKDLKVPGFCGDYPP